MRLRLDPVLFCIVMLSVGGLVPGLGGAQAALATPESPTPVAIESEGEPTNDQTAGAVDAPTGEPAAESIDENHPTLEVDEETVDRGDIVQGLPLVHEFVIRNTGTDTLIVSNAVAGCLCATLQAPEPVEPGASASIVVTVDTFGIDGPGGTDVIFETNDPQAPRVNLLLSAVVHSYLETTPTALRWLSVQGEKDGVLPIELTAKDGADFDILRVASSEPRVEVRYLEVPEDRRDPERAGGQWLIVTNLPADAEVGTLAGTLTIETDHPKQKQKRLPIHGIMRPLVQLTPPTAEFGEIVLTKEERSRYWLKAYGEEPIRVLEVNASVEGIDAELVPEIEGRAYKVYLWFRETLPKGPFKGTLTLRTDSSVVPVLEYPLTGTIVTESEAAVESEAVVESEAAVE